MFFRVCLGKPAVKPGGRYDRRLQRKWEKDQAAEDKKEADWYEGENRKLLEGYDTIGTNAEGYSDVWEMEVEDWEETGG